MTIRRDWFKRQVEIIAQAIGVVLGLKGKGETQIAAATLEAAVKKAFGMNGKLALSLPLDEFLQFACRGEEATPDLLATLAKLFDEWAGLLEEQGLSAQAALARDRAAALLQRSSATQ